MTVDSERAPQHAQRNPLSHVPYLTTRIFGGPFFRPNGGCPRQ